MPILRSIWVPVVDYTFGSFRNSPILPSVFTTYIDGCNQGCIKTRLDILDLFRECRGRNHCGKHRVLQQLPRRLRKWNIDKDEKDEAWGLNAVFAVSFCRVVLYHLLILTGSLLFWGIRLGKWARVWQNASVPFMAVVALVSLFWLPFARTKDAASHEHRARTKAE